MGFDSNSIDIQRLKKQNFKGNVKFIDCLLDAEGEVVEVDSRMDRYAILESRKIHFQDLTSIEEKSAANYHDRLPISKNKINLVDFLHENDVNDVDFIKIDIDGLYTSIDLRVLKSLKEFLSKGSVLGVGVEVLYCGSDSSDEHTFHNTDKFYAPAGLIYLTSQKEDIRYLICQVHTFTIILPNLSMEDLYRVMPFTCVTYLQRRI